MAASACILEGGKFWQKQQRETQKVETFEQ